MNRIILILVLIFGFGGVSNAQTLYGTLPEAIVGRLQGENSSYRFDPANVYVLASKVYSGAGSNGADLCTVVAFYLYRPSSSSTSYASNVIVHYYNISSPSGGYYTYAGVTNPATVLSYGSGTTLIVPKAFSLRDYFSDSDEVMWLLENYNSAVTSAIEVAKANSAYYGINTLRLGTVDVYAIMNHDTDGGGVPDYAELLDQPSTGNISNWIDDYTCSCGVCCVHECTCGYYWSGADCNGTYLPYVGCSCHAIDTEDDRCDCGACCNHSCEQKQTNPDYAKRHYTLVYGLKVECDGTGKTPHGCACHRTCVCGADCYHCCTCSYFQPRDCLGRFKDCSCHQNGILCPCGACCECTCLCGDFPYECLGHATSCSCHAVTNPDPEDPCTCEAGCYHCCTCGEFAWDYSKCQTCPCHFECVTCKAKCWHCCTCGNWSGSTDCAGRAIDCDCHITDPDPEECDCGACCACICICGNWNGESCSGMGSDHPNGCRCHDPNDCTCNACCSCTCICGNWTREECPGVPGYCVCHTTSNNEKQKWFPEDIFGTAFQDLHKKIQEKLGLDLLFMLEQSVLPIEPIRIEFDFGSQWFGHNYGTFRHTIDIQSYSSMSFFVLVRTVLLFLVVLTAIQVCIVVLRQY